MKALLVAFILCFRRFSFGEATNKSFSEWYEIGRLAYLDNDWEHCVQGFEKAVQAYKSYQNINLACKKQCQNRTKDNQDKIFQIRKEDSTHLDDDLLFYSKKIFYTLCIIKCKATSTNFVKDDDFVSKKVLEHFEALEPYNYLQLCYFQLKQHSKALQAAFTYYVTNYDDDVAKANLEYYMEVTGESYPSIENAEAFDHTQKFYEAKELYENGGEGGNWKKTIHGFEETLKAYLQEMENCRLSCEKSFDQGWYPDFISSTANHFTFCLKCKSQCEEKLSNLDGNVWPDFLPLIYNYLQYSYFKAGDVTKAAQSTASFLHFVPKDKAMINNKNYFMEELGLNHDVFQPRSEAVAYKSQQDAEMAVLSFIEREFAQLEESKEKGSGSLSKHEEL